MHSVRKRKAKKREKPLAARAAAAVMRAVGWVLAAPFRGLGYLLRGRVPRRTILVLDLEEGMVEYVPDDPLGGLRARRKVALRDMVDALQRAVEDDRVVAVLARLSGESTGFAQAEEVRGLVAELRARGKLTIAFSETFGEGGGGHRGYYLATGFDEIWLQPSGDVALSGLRADHPFLRRMLEKAGIQPQLDHRRDYKTAKNFYTEERYTEAHRESVESLISAIYDRLVEATAAGRGMTESEARELMDRGPFLARQAMEARLIDGMAYRDELEERLEDHFEGARFLDHASYLKRAGRPHRKGPAIALIYGVGAVHRGESGPGNPLPPFGRARLGSRTVSEAFRAAVDDDEVRAIVFRIDSPGGSYVASDTIWRETIRAREAGKPVIASMGEMAGSGGYFVAMDATKIVAHPSTLTGSIGVVAGKQVTRGLWEKLGVTWDGVQVGEGGTMWSAVEPYSDDDWRHLQATLDEIYADFKAKVAEARGLTAEQAESLAQGRVWTGGQAKDLGLVDELGGMPLAFRLAREAAGLDPASAFRIKDFPPKRSLLQALRGRPRRRAAAGAGGLFAPGLLDALDPVVAEARRAGILGAVQELEMPEIRIG